MQHFPYSGERIVEVGDERGDQVLNGGDAAVRASRGRM